MRHAVALCAVMTGVTVLGIGIGRTRSAPASASTRRVLYYEDPMHPAYRSSKPGIAPDCGMQLVPVFSEQAGLPPPTPNSAGTIAHLDGATRQLYGVQVAKAEQTSGSSDLHVYGRVAADDSLIYRVNLGTDGFVKTTADDAVGNHVTKNQHLAVIYSPDFLSVAGGYLSANERTPTGGAKDSAAQAQNSASAQARADRLRNLGMSDAQIDEIGADRRIPEDVYVVSPTDGFILSRDISSGMRFEKHAELYRIADLRHVWILAELFGADASAVRPGAVAHIVLSESGEHFTAHVTHVLPEVDPVSHGLEARLEVANPGYHLRPGMFVDVMLPSPLHAGLTIPATAVLNTGLSKQVFIEVSEGYFKQRQIHTGWTAGDRIQVTDGLQEGDVVVSSGMFLMDSESRLHSAASSD